MVSWAVWAEEGDSPKSNVSDLSVTPDPEVNPKLLDDLNPNIVLVALKCFKRRHMEPFTNFMTHGLKQQTLKLDMPQKIPISGGGIYDGYNKRPRRKDFWQSAKVSKR